LAGVDTEERSTGQGQVCEAHKNNKIIGIGSVFLALSALLWKAYAG